MPINKGYLTAKTDKESDEVYTPSYAVKPIIKYIKPGSIVWCPFDTADSAYVEELNAGGSMNLINHMQC